MNQDNKPQETQQSQSDAESDPDTLIPRKKPRNESARVDQSIVKNEIIDQDITINSDEDDMIEIERCLEKYFVHNIKDCLNTRDLKLAFCIRVGGKSESGTEMDIEELREMEDAFGTREDEDQNNSDTAVSEFGSEISSDEEEEAPVFTRKRKH